MIVAVDFDGTCVEHEYPVVGRDVPHAADVLRELVKRDHKLILYTMRDGQELCDAVDWFKRRGIALWAINKNPQQGSWTKSAKPYADAYIDDAAIGCPLLYPCGRDPYVAWGVVRGYLTQRGFF